MPADYALQVGRGVTLRSGTDVAIVGYGPMLLTNAWRAADELAAQGISAAVIDLPWLNRIDDEWVKTLGAFSHIVTLDNHYLEYGQGVMIAAALARTGVRSQLSQIGLTEIPACGSNADVLAYHGLDAAGIARDGDEPSDRRRAKPECIPNFVPHWIADVEVTPKDTRVVREAQSGDRSGDRAGRARRRGGSRARVVVGRGRGRGVGAHAGAEARRHSRPRGAAAARAREGVRRDRPGRNRQAVEERGRRSRLVRRPRDLHGRRGQPVLRQDAAEPDSESHGADAAQPIGICAAIMPFNSPLAGVAWKAFPALLCGNAVVVKSHELTPYTAVAFGKLLKDAGLPVGVYGAVQGFGPDAGAPLVQDHRVGVVSFTGSSATGKLIQKMVSEPRRAREGLPRARRQEPVRRL